MQAAPVAPPVDRSEFQVVLLSGGQGSKMVSPDMAQQTTDETPKALVDVGGRPLITYQLDLLEANGFTEVIIVTTSNAAAKIEALLKERPAKGVRYNVQTLRMPGGEAAAEPGMLGTADALRQVAGLIVSDSFLVLSGDIITRFPLRQLGAAHRVHSGALTALMVEHSETAETRRKEQGEYEQTEWIALDDASQSLLMMTPRLGAENSVDIPTSLFGKFPSFTIRTDLSDCHAYVFAKWVLQVIADRPDLRSIKQQVVPYLMRMQHSMTKRDMERAKGWGDADKDPQGLAMQLTSSLSGWPAGRAKVASRLHCHVKLVKSREHNVNRVNTVASHEHMNGLLGGKKPTK